jgi:hypothetical protein
MGTESSLPYLYDSAADVYPKTDGSSSYVHVIHLRPILILLFPLDVYSKWSYLLNMSI